MATITITELIDRAAQLAGGVGGDAAQSALIDAEFTLEVLLDHAINYVGKDWASDPAKRAQLKEAISVTFTDGVAAIPANLLEDWPAEAVFISTDEPSLRDLVSWQPHGEPATRKAYLFYFWVDATNIRLIRGAGDNYTGAVTMTAAKQPVLSDGNLVAPSHYIEDTLLCLAATMRGEIPLAVLIGKEYAPKKK